MNLLVIRRWAPTMEIESRRKRFSTANDRREISVADPLATKLICADTDEASQPMTIVRSAEFINFTPIYMVVENVV